MFKYVLTVFTLLIVLGCSSSPNNIEINSVNNNVRSTYVTLSHVKAYLLLGNIPKAEQLFHSIESPELNAKAILTLAELNAAKGNSIDAQQVFLSALTDEQFEVPLNKANIPSDLLDYFCAEKKWPALQGYASAVIASPSDDSTQNISPSAIHLKNNVLTQIGLCFFDAKHWEEAQKWLQKLDTTQQLAPQAYLALARMAVEQKQYSAAQALINKYETTKTTIDAKMLWTAFEVYQALDQSETAEQTGENLYSLFPNNEYTRKYILTKKRDGRIKRKQQETLALLETINSSTKKKLPSPPVSAYEQSTHIMEKGETLYQLSKRYDVSIADLLKWNPDLLVNDIPLGASVRLFAD